MKESVVAAVLAWCAAVLGAVGCSYVPPPVRPPSKDLPAQVERALGVLAGADRTEAIVLVVLDGARWQDVLVGADPSLAVDMVPGDVVAADALMPNLHAMIARGALIGAPGSGETLWASGPDFISLPGYTEILSGRTPLSCVDNDCPATREPTLVDEVRAGEGSVAVFASWAPIARVAARGPHPGVLVSTGDPETSRFRADARTAALALAHLARVRPGLLFLGLGEPDELAHQGDYGGYLDTLRQADVILGELALTLAGMGERGRRTSVFVTCDHGRATDFRHHGARWPESSRVWLVAVGGSIPARGAVQGTASHRLRDIAPTIRALLGLPADVSPLAGSAIQALLPVAR